MADTKLINLPAVSSFTDDDLLYVVVDPSGTPLSKRIRIGDFFAGAPPVSGGSFGGDLDDLNDVNAPSPSAGDVLTWSGVAWVAAAPPSGGGSGPSGSFALDDLTDVNASSPAVGEVLTWDGLEWVAQAPSVSGGGSVSGGAGFGELIEVQILESAAASVTFSIPAGYKHLRLISLVRGTHASTNRQLRATFNGDTGSNYKSGYQVAGTSWGQVAEVQPYGFFGHCTAASAASNTFAPNDFTIYDYAGTTKTKTWIGLATITSDLYVVNYGGNWASLSAITSLSIFPVDGNLDVGSYFALYGIPEEPSAGGGSIDALDDIGDVNAPSPSAGDVLTWYAGAWIAAPPPSGGGSSPSGSFALDDLTDVDAPSPDDGDVLMWDASEGKWKAVAFSAVSGGGFGGGGGALVQFASQSETTMTSAGTQIPIDNTVPQNTEGTQIITCSITPTNASHKLRIRFTSWASITPAAWVVIALFQDSNANALQATTEYISVATAGLPLVLEHIMDAGTVAETTFKIRIGYGTPSATWTHLGISSAGYFGTIDSANLTIEEIDPTPGGSPSIGILDDLTDVDVPTPADGEVLMWDEANNKWIAAPPPVSGGGFGGALDDLSDVTAPSPAHGAVLQWDEDINEWVPGQSNAEYDAGNSGTALTLNWNNGVQQIVTLTGNVTFTFSNPVAGRAYRLILKQDATGGRTITWPASVKWEGGTAPTLTTTALNVTFVSLVYTALGSDGYLGFATVAAITSP